VPSAAVKLNATANILQHLPIMIYIAAFQKRFPQNTEALWMDVSSLESQEGFYIIIDESTLNKSHAQAMKLTGIYWSGNHHNMVQGISLVILVWANGLVTCPIHFRIYHKDGAYKTKNIYFTDMLNEAKNRQFYPERVIFDSWYGSVDNLKLIRRLVWHFLTRLKKNRKVNYEYTVNLTIEKQIIPVDGLEVHLKNYGRVRVFHRDDNGNGILFWAMDILLVDENTREILAENANKIEGYHRNMR